MKMTTVFWILVPGLGQIHLRHAGRGVLLFGLFAFLLNAWLLCPLLVGDSVVRTTIFALTVLAWLISAVDFVRRSADIELDSKT